MTTEEARKMVFKSQQFMFADGHACVHLHLSCVQGIWMPGCKSLAGHGRKLKSEVAMKSNVGPLSISDSVLLFLC